MRTLRNFTVLTTVLIFVTVSSAFAFKRPLITESASPSDVKGVFTLILYGANYSDDLETVAILDKEGDGYTFVPFAPQFNYKVKKGIQAQEALKEAEQFVSFHNAFWKYQLSKILNPEGVTIGFEVRPLYLSFVYGFSDILDIYYWLKADGKVKVVIRLDNVMYNTRIPGGDSPASGGK